MPFSRRLWRVLGEVGLADEVGGMEAGLRTVVGSGGTRLSGGQAQRLTVARNLPTGVGRTWSRILRASLPVPWREAVGQLMGVQGQHPRTTTRDSVALSGAKYHFAFTGEAL